MRTCEQCGREFAKNPSMAYKQFERQRFCSKVCGGAHKSAQRPLCRVDGCDRLSRVRRLCDMHHYRLIKHGTVDDPIKPTVEERFWSFVKVGDDDECWEWTGRRQEFGYGRFHVSNTPPVKEFSHRFSYALATGVDISGLEVRHRCDNPPCVNPSHLIHGTHADNMADAKERGRLNISGLALGRLSNNRPKGSGRPA